MNNSIGTQSSVSTTFPNSNTTAAQVTFVNGEYRAVTAPSTANSQMTNVSQSFNQQLIAPHSGNDQQLQTLLSIIQLLIVMLLSSIGCLLYTSPSPRDLSTSRMPSSA